MLTYIFASLFCFTSLCCVLTGCIQLRKPAVSQKLLDLVKIFTSWLMLEGDCCLLSKPFDYSNWVLFADDSKWVLVAGDDWNVSQQWTGELLTLCSRPSESFHLCFYRPSKVISWFGCQGCICSKSCLLYPYWGLVYRPALVFQFFRLAIPLYLVCIWW